MKNNFFPQRLKIFLLTVLLIIIHLYLGWRSNDNDLFTGSLLLWSAVVYLLLEKSDKCLGCKYNLSSFFSGLFIINCVLFKSINAVDDNIFLRIYPLLSMIGIALLASEFEQIKEYGQIFMLTGFLAIPWESVFLVVDLSLLTANFSAFILYLLGFEVSRQGILVSLPTGSIEVYYGCAGLKQIVQLLGLTVIIFAIIPTTLKQKIVFICMAIAIGFVSNSLRVALMTILVALSHEEAFEYWHLGDGSLIFSLISVLLFGAVCAWYYMRGLRLLK